MKKRLWCTALAWLAADAALAEALPEEVSGCLSALDEAQASGEYAEEEMPLVGLVCLDFYAAINESPWADILPANELYYLDRAGLATLIALAAGYEAAPAARIATDPLNAIVAELEPFVPDEEASLWERFTDWVEGLFESESGDSNWLSDWLNSFSFSETASNTLVRIIALAALVTVLAILINELRLGGAFVRSQQRRRRFAGAAVAAAHAAEIDLDAVMRAETVKRKIELMFSLVVGRLQRRHGAALHAGRTHDELATCADQLSTELREPFIQVVKAAERVTYANWEPHEDELRHVLESGKSVVDRAGDETDQDS